MQPPRSTLGRLAVFTAAFALALLIGSTAIVAAGGESSLAAQSLASAVAALAAGVLMMRWAERRPAGALGIAWTTRTVREVAVGLAIGAGSIGLCAGILALAGWLTYSEQPGTAWTWTWVVVTTLGGFTVAAFAEEILFRGYPFQVLVQRMGAAPAVVLFSVMFAFAHVPNPNVSTLGLLNIGLAGVLLSVAYLRTRSIWFATALHLGWNWGMASLLDLPVSGLEIVDTPFYQPVLSGPRALTGADFGPEGGLIGTVGFGVALAAVLLWPSLRPAPELLAMHPLPDSTARRLEPHT